MIISEIGLNHKGNETKAFSMLKKLVETEIDAVTFQIVKPKREQNPLWREPLSREFYKNAIKYVHDKGKLIGFSISDKEMIHFLNDNGADFWKTMSPDISNYELQMTLMKTQKMVFVSTGMSDESEIIEKSEILKNIRLIHTQLSHEVKDVNLSAINRIKNITGKEVAFGLHCPNINLLYVALAFNPSDIFFYVKDDLKEFFPDDEHAIMLDDVNSIIDNIKILKDAIGDGIKKRMEKKFVCKHMK